MNPDPSLALPGTSNEGNTADPPPPKSSGTKSKKDDKSLHSTAKKVIEKASTTKYHSSRSLEARLDALEKRMSKTETNTRSQLDVIQSMLSSLVDDRAATSLDVTATVGNVVPSSSNTLPHQCLAFPPPNLPLSTSIPSPGQVSNALFTTPASAFSTPTFSNFSSLPSTSSSSLFSSSSPSIVSPLPPFPVASTSVISDQLMSQLKAGERTPLELQMKIINNEYVDFHDILFPDSASKFILSFEANHSPMLVKDSKKRDLTENQWNKAFAEFAAIYTKAHPSTVTDLYTYQKRILYLMERKANWHYFMSSFAKTNKLPNPPGLMQGVISIWIVSCNLPPLPLIQIRFPALPFPPIFLVPKFQLVSVSRSILLT